MKLNPIQIERLSEKVACDVTTPNGATVLQLDIEKVTGSRIGLNTVKRLVGVLSDESTPRLSTLDVIARYLGYAGWTALENDTVMEGSGFGRPDIFVDMSVVPEGTSVEVAWEPSRRLLLKSLGGGRYEVTESRNCKLASGDLLTLMSLAKGYPFMALDVWRGDIKLGNYRAADGAVLTELDIR